MLESRALLSRLLSSLSWRRAVGTQAQIKITNLTLRDIVASDFTGTSDPFCMFFTQPEGLIRALRTPRTPVKWRVRPGEKSGAVGEASISRQLTKQLSRMASSPQFADKRKAQAQWRDAELPTLQLTCPVDELENACLIVAVFDFDRFSANDPMGTVVIPLGRPKLGGDDDEEEEGGGEGGEGGGGDEDEEGRGEGGGG